jgi:hypothetical protein
MVRMEAGAAPLLTGYGFYAAKIQPKILNSM